jgi:heptosyltransferase I
MNILIVKTSSLGDIVQAFPVLEQLKHHFPEASIDWVVERPFAELLQAHPLIDQVLIIDSKRWRKQVIKKQTWQELIQFRQNLQMRTYDWVIDLQGNTKSAGVTFLAKSTHKVGFGWQTVPEWPNYLVTHYHINPPKKQTIQEDYLAFVEALVAKNKTKAQSIHLLNLTTAEQQQQLMLNQFLQTIPLPKIMICPGSQWTNKQMALLALQQFLQLIKNQMSAHFVFIWGSPAEYKIVEELSAHFQPHALILAKSSLPLLQSIMQSMDCIISMDSLPLHLAATTTTPTYSLFGASSAQKYKPSGDQHEAFQGICPYGKTFEKRCPILRTCPTGSCIKEINIQFLFNHFFSWWNMLKKEKI